jgi:hypothetical protein
MSCHRLARRLCRRCHRTPSAWLLAFAHHWRLRAGVNRGDCFYRRGSQKRAPLVLLAHCVPAAVSSDSDGYGLAVPAMTTAILLRSSHSARAPPRLCSIQRVRQADAPKPKASHAESRRNRALAQSARLLLLGGLHRLTARWVLRFQL